MTYLRSLFINFLIVFFVVKVIPGVILHSFEDAPNIGADILFSVIVGFLNSIIVPALVGLNVTISYLKIAIIGFVISFLSFIIIGIFNIGISANVMGIIIGGLLVWIFSYFTNYLELKHLRK